MDIDSIDSVSLVIAAATLSVAALYVTGRFQRRRARFLVPLRGVAHDPRPPVDNDRRGYAYLLIGLAAVLVIGLMAMVAFGAFGAGELKQFDVIIQPIMSTLAGACPVLPPQQYESRQPRGCTVTPWHGNP